MADAPWWHGQEGAPYPPDSAAEDTPSDILSRGRDPRGGAAARAIGSRAALPPAARPPVRAVVQVGPPDVLQYPEAVDFYAAGSNAAIANLSTVTLAQVTLGGGMVGRISSIIIGGWNLVVGLDATFSLLIAGAPAPGWNARRLPPQNAAASFLTYGPDEILIRVPEAATVILQATVTAGGPASLSGQFAGWQFPRTTRDAYASVWRP